MKPHRLSQKPKPDQDKDRLASYTMKARRFAASVPVFQHFGDERNIDLWREPAMTGRIGSREIEPTTHVNHTAGSAPTTSESEITNFSTTLHNTAPAHPSLANPTGHTATETSVEQAAAHIPAVDVTAEPKAKPTKTDKSTSDKAKDFGDKFDKILKPLTVTLGSTAQIASLVSFGEAQAKNNDASSSKDTGTSGDASGTGTSGTTGQLPDLAPIPSQQTS